MATITPATNAATVAAIKSRRRGSVSVSRFGQPTELSPEPIVTTSTTPSTRPSRSSSLVIQKAAFYSVGSQNILQHGSADSLASESANDPDKLVEDVSQSTQIATIAGKQSISKAISRRLSRARTRSRELLGGGGVGTSASANLSLTGGNGNGVVMIDVAVTEATVEYHHSDDEDLDGRPKSSAAVYSGDGPMEKLRTQRSAPGLQQQQSGEKAGWMSKARDLTARIKRRSMAALA
ncbi:hypothetical protein K474DRAFT_664133 [Panus rudis PR-1116 ss-1]|nr:hypothetical protein K474DRAFT_664133 [Panus rudis PR-1116 ss-1]